jgi:hypothetical protein
VSNHSTIGTCQSASWDGVREKQVLAVDKLLTHTWKLICKDSGLLSDSIKLKNNEQQKQENHKNSVLSF